MLRHMPPIVDPNVLVAADTADDAAVYRIGHDLAIVLTADYFTPVVDDPYLFGAIAAANALSDVYAMGARPFMAINLIGFPVKSKKLPLPVLTDILRGGNDKATEAGVSIAGGHSIDDDEPKYGLAVVGLVHPDRILTNTTARIGDTLILTKPIGTGIVSTGIKFEAISQRTIDRAVEIMTVLNKSAAEAVVRVGVNACTDVTGYGLLGHLREMTTASKVGAQVRLREVPVIPEIWDLLKEDLAPGGTHTNREFLEDAVLWDPSISEEEQLALCDAQTSGGLLVAVSAERRTSLLKALKEAGTLAAAEIGEIVEDTSGRIEVVP